MNTSHQSTTPFGPSISYLFESKFRIHMVIAPLVILFACASFLNAQTSTPGGGGGGGGGGGSNPQVTLSASENPILVGNTVIASATTSGFSGDLTYSWGIKCADATVDPPLAAIAGPNGSQKAFAISTIKNQIIICNVSDTNGNSVTEELELTVQEPNELKIALGTVVKSVQGNFGEVVSAVHEFELRRNGVKVGGATAGTAGEKMWDRTFGVEPISWIPQGPSLYFTAPKIYDTRFFTIPTNWDDIPDGTVGIDFNQLVKVDVSQCGGGTKEFKSKLLRFTIKKINDTSIEFKVVED